MFNIIKINKNNTAIAPTYTINKIIGRNSILNKNNKHAALANVKIKNKTENTGFLVKITKNDDKIAKPENTEKKQTLPNIK